MDKSLEVKLINLARLRVEESLEGQLVAYRQHCRLLTPTQMLVLKYCEQVTPILLAMGKEQGEPPFIRITRIGDDRRTTQRLKRYRITTIPPPSSIPSTS